MKKIFSVIVVLIVAFVVYLYYTPYIAVNGLVKAVEAQDSDKVSQYIDFGSVKSNMSDQFQAVFMKKLMADPRAQNNKAATVMIVGMLSKIVDGLTSAIASPTAITKILGGVTSSDNFNSQDARSQTEHNMTVAKLRDAKGKYLEMNRFQLTAMSKSNLPIKMVFERTGLTEWKMKKLTFAEEAFNHP